MFCGGLKLIKLFVELATCQRQLYNRHDMRFKCSHLLRLVNNQSFMFAVEIYKISCLKPNVYLTINNFSLDTAKSKATRKLNAFFYSNKQCL